MRVEAASDLLKSTTWREFFVNGVPEKKSTKERQPSNERSEEVGREKLNKDENESFDEPIGSKSASSLSLQIRKLEMMQNLDSIYNTLVYRVEDLWDTLKISLADRKFYRKSLCNGPVQSIDHCKELASYVIKLQQYKTSTLEVLQSIKLREESINKFYDQFASLQRKYSRLQIKDLAYRVNTSSLSLDNINESSAVENSTEWKEELIYSLDEVRCNTLDVIKNIQLWRRNLWRPLPFVWNNRNYLQKMRSDMNILESESSKKILNLLSMRPEDLLCVIFFEFRGKENSIWGPAQGEISPESPDENRSQQLVPPLSPLPMSSASLNNNSFIQNIVLEFTENIPLSELQEAATVVLEDDMMQQAIQSEREALTKKGYFIPSLKLKPHKSRSSRQSSRKNSKTGIDGDNTEVSGIQHTLQKAVTALEAAAPESTIDFDREDFNDAFNNNPAMQSIMSTSFPPYKPFSYENNATETGGGIGELGFNTANDEQSTAKTVPLNENTGNNTLRITVGEDNDEELDISLYASFEEEEKKQRDEVVEEGDDLYDIPSLLDTELLNNNQQGENGINESVQALSEELEKMLQGDGLVEFEDNNQTTFGKDHVLHKVAAFLCKYPEMDIHIESHMNCNPPCSGDECSQCELSDERCQAVELFLLENSCANQCLTMGWGCKHPMLGSKNLIRLFP
mmetsp:Transcript_29162/g.40062  ORF Transcript_29162/g.40062 Transcript_29162/m.40062 type:complete len:683 (+) Transcript_29162:267-2315(+)